MNIGFIHQKLMEAEGEGSTHSATIIPRELVERGHDVTVYCPTTDCRSEQSAPASDDFDIVTFPAPKAELRPRRRFSAVGHGIRNSLSIFEEHDVIHSYESPISDLAELRSKVAVPVVTTLNGYGQVCPKKDLYHNDYSPCRKNGLFRCTECIFRSTLSSSPSDRFDGASLYDNYDGFERIPASAYQLAQRFHNLREVRSIEQSSDEIDAYHVQADHLKETYSAFGFPRGKFHTVPNMLDESFLVENRANWSNPYQLLYVGSLIKKKGPQLLPQVMSRLNEKSEHQFELTIVGGGYLKQELERQVEEQGLAVDVIGRVPYGELPSLYSRHDVFLYPGIWEEPFARVFLEAMASGTPIVGSDVGDIRLIVGDAGITTDGSVTGLASGVIELIKSGELPKKAERAQERAQEYLPSTVMPKMEEMYRYIASL